ncbi:hypothetical protein TrLO_g5943 [Triparma laevis f. longispina]|uniref:Uncharacterized protein n=1 Tax=Triparma laevis f. longispina TaxID=1714387 RepID=A0A9W7ARG9_9STRA|nr:hypothetical protein TrLO_g5943 [Triparma laevis f. longispina]
MDVLSPINGNISSRRRGSKTRATASANKRLQNRRKSSGSKSPTRNYPSNAENQQYLSNAQPSPKKWASAVPKSTKSNVSANSPTKVNRLTSIEWEDSKIAVDTSYSDVNNSFSLLSSSRHEKLPATPGAVSAISCVTMEEVGGDECGCWSWLGFRSIVEVVEDGEDTDETLIIEEQPRMDFV